MQINDTVLVFSIVLALTPCASAQWVGGDAPPVEQAQKQIVTLGSDKTTSGVPGGPSAVVTVKGEGWGTPPIYTVKQSQIAALKLNKDQEAILKADFPAFIPWTMADYGSRVKYYPYSKLQLPYAVRWDFNDKKNPALAIAGHDSENNYIVILRPEKNGYKLIKWRTYAQYPEEMPVLRLLNKGSVIRVNQSCDPTYMKEIWHAGFGDMKVYVSTDYPPEEWFQSDSANGIVYYHEGLFPVESWQITGLKQDGPAAFAEKYLKNILLTTDMKKALAKYNKDFVVWKNSDYPKSTVSGYRYSSVSLPYAIKHDLNGDGVDDMVLAGHDNDSNMVLELLSGTSGYFARSVTIEPCYQSARERKETLEPRPSHVLALHTASADFADLSTEATKGFWSYNGDVLIGLRMINTCREPKRPPKTNLEEQSCDSAGNTEYGRWQPELGTEKENMYVYGEKEDSEGYGCLGGDSCRLEVLPPGSALR